LIKLFHDQTTGTVYADSERVGSTVSDADKKALWELIRILDGTDVYIPQSIRDALIVEPEAHDLYNPSCSEWASMHPVRMKSTKQMSDARNKPTVYVVGRKKKGRAKNGQGTSGSRAKPRPGSADDLLAQADRWLKEHKT
jgi:hypothetical protein